MHRMALVDYTFADGTFIPKGTMVAVGQLVPHRDNTVYKNADAFEPFRFDEMAEDRDEAAKHQLVATSSSFLTFGHRRHAWYVPSYIVSCISALVRRSRCFFDAVVKLPSKACHFILLLSGSR